MGKRILVVDDDEMVLLDLLNAAQFHVDLRHVTAGHLHFRG